MCVCVGAALSLFEIPVHMHRAKPPASELGRARPLTEKWKPKYHPHRQEPYRGFGPFWSYKVDICCIAMSDSLEELKM